MTRVLLVRLSAMGDVVHSLGAVEALARARPDLELHFAVQPSFAPLLERLDYLTSVFAHQRRPVLSGMTRTARALRALDFDVALDLQGNWKSALVCWLSGARQRIGAAQRMRREPASRLLLTRSVRPAGAPHPARLAHAIVRELAPDARELPSRLVAAEEEVAREAEAVRAVGLDPTAPFRALVYSGDEDPRDWPFEAMLRETRLGTLPALWVTGPAEQDSPFPDGVPVVRHARGELRRLIALGHLVARSGGVAMGPDRGATHVLAACGAETRVMFGPQDPARTAPTAASVLVRADSPSCVPCRRRRCTHADGPVCMNFTSAEASPWTL